MVELLAVGAGLVVLAVVLGVIALVFKLVFFAITLPFRILGGILKLTLGLLLLPVLAVAGVVGVLGLGIAAVFALLVPLLPVALAVLAVWGLARMLSRRPAAAPSPVSTPRS